MIEPDTELLPEVAELELVDHHCHGVSRSEPDRTAFEEMLTEAGRLSPFGTSLFDSLIGHAVRRWCPPVLDLPAHTSAQDYLERRGELGATEVNRRFLRATGTARFLLDTGIPGAWTTPGELGALAGGRTHEVVRLESVAEEVVRAGTGAAEFSDRVDALLAERTREAVGLKSIAAYRVGLELPGARPTPREVRAAAGQWLSEAGPAPRLADEVLHRFLVWRGVDLGLPIQFHAGYGDPDLDLHRCDPSLLTDLLRATRASGVPILLLHNYPYHRRAAYLAQVFEHVFVDVGLATHNAGSRAPALIAETLEVAPFGKVLFSTDAFGLAELYHLGTLLFRRGLGEFLRTGLDSGDWTRADAARTARLIGHDNARRVYGLDP